jgi:hypothetical protein
MTMELDVTHMIEDADAMPTLSGSIAELGNSAGRITWNNSLAYAAARPLLNAEQIEEARNHFAEYGAWSREEIAAWSEAEVQGLVVQEVASWIRELEHYDSEADYFAAAERGNVSGSLCRGDDEKWYAYFGN